MYGEWNWSRLLQAWSRLVSPSPGRLHTRIARALSLLSTDSWDSGRHASGSTRPCVYVADS